jgi:predicted AlkP superfamily phosphohydrolase/phosphomutase
VLKTLINLQTGNPIVKEVYHADEVFPGPQRGRLPDLIVAWHEEPVLNGVFSKEIGRIEGKSPDPRSGNHKPQGFAILHGSGINKQRVLEARMVDIAPTVLQYFGLNAPAHFDGKALAGVFDQ